MTWVSVSWCSLNYNIMTVTVAGARLVSHPEGLTNVAADHKAAAENEPPGET